MMCSFEILVETNVWQTCVESSFVFSSNVLLFYFNRILLKKQNQIFLVFLLEFVVLSEYFGFCARTSIRVCHSVLPFMVLALVMVHLVCLIATFGPLLT